MVFWPDKLSVLRKAKALLTLWCFDTPPISHNPFVQKIHAEAKGRGLPSLPMDAELNSLIDAVRAAAAQGRTLRLRGGGTKDFWGQSLTGDVLDTRAYQGIVSYEPSELVVTVRCGTPLSELEAAF